MSLAETVKASAALRNAQRVSGLTAKLDALRSAELRTADDLIQAFRPLVSTMADLMQDVDTSRSQTADLLDRLESALNRLEARMTTLPDQMQEASRETVEVMASRVEKLAEALNSVGERAAAQVKDTSAEATTATQSATATLTTAEHRMGESLQRVEAAAKAAAAQMQQARHHSMVMTVLVAIGSGLLTSVFVLWGVARMSGLSAPWARLLGQ